MGYMAKAEQATSQSLTGHWHCQSPPLCGCNAAVLPLEWGLGSVSEPELASVVALILAREAKTKRGGFFPSLDDFEGAHCCIVTSVVDFLVFPLFYVKMSVFEVEVSNLLPLQDCKVTD